MAEGTEEAQAAGAFSDVADGEQAEVRALLDRVSMLTTSRQQVQAVALTEQPRS